MRVNKFIQFWSSILLNINNLKKVNRYLWRRNHYTNAILQISLILYHSHSLLPLN